MKFSKYKIINKNLSCLCIHFALFKINRNMKNTFTYVFYSKLQFILYVMEHNWNI